MGQVERADDLLFVLRAVLHVVGDHQNRAVVEHLVEERVGRQHLLQRLLERHAVQLHTVGRRIAIVAAEGDVDPVGRAEEIEDVPDARGRAELEVGWLARCRVEERFGRHLPRLVSHLCDARPWAGRLHLLPDHAVELSDLACELAIRGLVLAGPLELAQRGVELALGFELLARKGVDQRGLNHGALQSDTVFRSVRIVLHGLAVVADGRVPVVALRGVKALFVGHGRGTTAQGGDQQRQDHQRGQPCHHDHQSPFTTRTGAASAAHGRRHMPSRWTLPRCARFDSALRSLRLPSHRRRCGRHLRRRA